MLFFFFFFPFLASARTAQSCEEIVSLLSSSPQLINVLVLWEQGAILPPLIPLSRRTRSAPSLVQGEGLLVFLHLPLLDSKAQEQDLCSHISSFSSVLLSKHCQLATGTTKAQPVHRLSDRHRNTFGLANGLDREGCKPHHVTGGSLCS